MLSTSAFNALLKTIEEPPPYVVFMFATTEIHKVPATIKSRCQQFNFRLIPTETIKGLLAQAARETGVEADDDALLWIAKEATGSMRDAYTLFDQVVSFSGGKLSSASIREKLGLVGIERLNALFEVCFSGDGKATLESLDSILSSGVSVEQFVADSAEYLRSLMLVKNGIVRDSLLGAPAQAYSAKALGAVDAERIERALAIALGAHRDLRYSVSPRFELELAFSRIASLASTYTREEIARAMDRIQAALSGTEPKSIATASRPAPGAIAGAAPAADGKAQTGGAPEPEATASGAGSGATAESAFKDDAELEEARSADPALLRESVTKSFSKILPALASSLGKSGAWRIGERSVSIPFESGMDLEYVRREVGQIAAKVTEFAGRALSVELVKTAPTKQPERPREAEARPDAPDDDTDPVASVSRVFRGTVVSDGNGGNDELE
jgi:DNA polymerase-3 subunit gamma/tau